MFDFIFLFILFFNYFDSMLFINKSDLDFYFIRLLDLNLDFYFYRISFFIGNLLIFKVNCILSCLKHWFEV